MGILRRMHTSYGDMDVSSPRDRNGNYEPQLVRKYQNTIGRKDFVHVCERKDNW